MKKNIKNKNQSQQKQSINLDGVLQVRMKKRDLDRLKLRAEKQGLRLSQLARVLLLAWEKEHQA